MIRERRDRAVEQARRELSELRSTRDAEIRKLHSKEGLSAPRIAALLGCNKDHAYELLDPVRHETNNERRRKHARHLTLAA
jgi:hypothetical protein